MKAAEYDLMTPEDRDRKLRIFEAKRREWVETRSRGKARFILLDGLLRVALFNMMVAAFFVINFHISVALAAKIILLLLFFNSIVNLLVWHWKDNRFVTRARL